MIISQGSTTRHGLAAREHGELRAAPVPTQCHGSDSNSVHDGACLSRPFSSVSSLGSIFRPSHVGPALHYAHEADFADRLVLKDAVDR